MVKSAQVRGNEESSDTFAIKVTSRQSCRQPARSNRA
jgi:hypothetical protein